MDEQLPLVWAIFLTCEYCSLGERAIWNVFVSRRTYSVLVQVGGIETPLVLGEQSV